MTTRARGGRPARSETADRYLETIFYIQHEGETVRPSRVAEWLGVSAPTVSVALHRLAEQGWLRIGPDRSVTLTDAGDAAASEIVRRHRLVERWLCDVLGLDWAAADPEAERLAPGMSDLVLDRLDAHLGHPATCPHGNTIPGRRPPQRLLVALADLEPGTPASVERISEVAEHEAPALLRTLLDLGLVPGTVVRVQEGDAADGALAVQVGDRTVALSTATGRLIWVAPSARATA